MSAVMIKGMEMPRTCFECKLADSFCLVTRMTYRENPNKWRQRDCPLIPIVPVDGEERLYKER